MAEHQQMTTQLDLNFSTPLPLKEVGILTSHATSESQPAAEKVPAELHASASSASFNLALVVPLSRFRPMSPQDSTAQLYDQILDSIKHIG